MKVPSENSIKENTVIRNPRYPKKPTGRRYIVFNATLDKLPFTIFPEMHHYNVLAKMINLKIKTANCRIAWKRVASKYNRCEGLYFPDDFLQKINELERNGNSGFSDDLRF